MSDTIESLRRKIEGASDLETVVRTMKAVAASSIGQYEGALLSLTDYYRTVELGLVACFRQTENMAVPKDSSHPGTMSVIVFGSDQGLVGQFNDILADFVTHTLKDLPGEKEVWAVGERIYARLLDEGLPIKGMLPVPNSINAITPLVGQLLMQSSALREKGEAVPFYLFHNRPKTGSSYEPVCQRLLPLDASWKRDLTQLPWPTKRLPEVIGSLPSMLLALIREYLFVSIFKACAESLASENASRLAAMQRAEKSIEERLDELRRTFHRLRQSTIDEELFDVIAGFEALTKKKTPTA